MIKESGRGKEIQNRRRAGNKIRKGMKEKIDKQTKSYVKCGGDKNDILSKLRTKSKIIYLIYLTCTFVINYDYDWFSTNED